MKEIVFMLVEQQAQQEKDMTKHEREVQAQIITMQQHMESLLQVVNESTTTAKLPHRTLDVKLVPYWEILFSLDLRSRNDIILLIRVSASEKSSHEADKWYVCFLNDGFGHR